MSFLNRFMSFFSPSRQGDGAETSRVVHYGPTAGGVRVDADTALRNATVWACIRYLSSTVAQLPWRVHQTTAKGSARAPSHPVDRLLQRPNPEMGSFTFRETLVGWATRYGNGVAEIQWDARGVPVAMWPIHPTRVQFKRDAETNELLFEVAGDDGTKRLLRGEDVYHVRGFGEGAVGLDVISYAAESIGWAQATEVFGAAFFGNGMNPSMLIEVPGKLSPDGKKALDAELAGKHAGPKKSSRIAILDAGMKAQKVSVEPDNAQFIETRQHQVEEICRWFGVPPHKVMHLLRATFTNIEHQSIEVVVDSITPWVLRMEQEGDFKLFGRRAGGCYTKMDLKGLLRGDFKSRQEGLQIQRRNGVINANDWCRLEDMPEIGPAGDKYIVEGNMTTLDAIGEEPPAPAAAPQPGSQESSGGADDDQSPVERARRQAARAQLH